MTTDLRSLYQAELRGLRAERLAVVDARTFAKVALLPEWSQALAAEVGLAPDGQVEQLVTVLDDAGWIDQRRGIGRRGRRFWLRPRERPDVGRHLRGVLGAGLEDELRRLAESLRGRLEPAHAPWFAVVDRFQHDPTGLQLVEEVDRLIVEDALADAVRLVAAAAVVGDILGGGLADAVRRARWRVDRAHRAERDARYLEHYLGRATVTAAVDELLAADNPRWALHLKGLGGVGKTMFIRYVSSEPFAAGGTVVVARVDFDHLDPRYPEQRLGDLLVALAGDLLGFGTTRLTGREHRRLLEAADLLHDELSRSYLDPAAIDRLTGALVARFAGLLRSLSAPALLILDTCEELAKLYPAGVAAPAIDSTFDLMERVHDQDPRVRVILAGRRNLVPDPDPAQAAADPLLRPRRYLRVLPVEDFTRTEAERYLDLRDAHRGGEPRLRQEIRAAILRLLGERGRPAEDDGTDGFSPFELNAYCEWAYQEPDLDPAALLATDGDPYIERRILARLQPDHARHALPAALAFGRFDQRLLTPALNRLGVPAQAAFDGLAAQEWVSVLALGPTGLPYLLGIDEHLRERLARAVAPAAADLAALGRDAADLVAGTPLVEVAPETVEAAVRLLPAAEAAAFWQRLDDRILQDRAWGWAAQVSARAGAVEVATRPGDDGPSVIAAILATQASVRLHTGTLSGLQLLWDAVGREAHRHPDRDLSRELLQRSVLGRLAYGGLDEPPSGFDVADCPSDAVVAAQLGLAERGLHLGYPLTLLGDDLDLARGAYAALMTVWLAAEPFPLPDEEQTAPPTVAVLLRETVTASPADPPPPGLWRDWVPPANLLDRCRLAAVLGDAADPALRRANLRTRTDWATDAEPRLPDTDADRLRSAVHRLDGVPRRPDRRPRPAPATCWLQRVAPADEVARLEHAVRNGEVSGLDTLRALVADAAAHGDADLVEAGQLALLRGARRWRSTDHVPNLDELCAIGTPAVRAEAWLLRTQLTGLRPPDPETAGSVFGWWRCQRTAVLEHPETPEPPRSEPGIPDAGSAAVRTEYLRARNRRVGAFPAAGPAVFVDPAALAEHIQAWIVATPQVRHPKLLERLSRHGHPPAHLGAALLEAGEALAWRQPAAAAALFAAAIDTLLTAPAPGWLHRQAVLLRALLAKQHADNPAQEPESYLRELAERPPGPSTEDRVLAELRLRMRDWTGKQFQRSAAWQRRLEYVRSPDVTADTSAVPPELCASGPADRVEEPPAPQPPVKHLPQFTVGSVLSLVLRPVAMLSGPALLLGALTMILMDLPDSTNTYYFAPVRVLGWVFLLLSLIPTGIALTEFGRDVSSWLAGFTWSLDLWYPTSQLAVERANVWRELRGLPMQYASAVADTNRPQLGKVFARSSFNWNADLPWLRAAVKSRSSRQTLLRLEPPAQSPELPIERMLSAEALPARVPNLLWFRSIRGGDWRSAGQAKTGRWRALHLTGAPVTNLDGTSFRATARSEPLSFSTHPDDTLGNDYQTYTPQQIADAARFVILQAEHSDAASATLGDQFGPLVRLANSCVAAGALAVFLIPPVPDRLRLTLSSAVAHHLEQGKRPTRRDAIRLLGAFKDIVWAHDQSADAVLDVLLFMDGR